MNEIFPILADAIKTIAVYALPLLFAITMHVAAQCYMANYLGDKTAQMLGRLSLNPSKHIDPVGTILLPVLSFFVTKLSGFPFIFGYAKPLPIDFSKLRNPKRDMMWVSLAGLGANFVMAAAWVILKAVFNKIHFNEEFFVSMTDAGMQANLVLMAIYLIPLPPFDGGRIVFSLLPQKQAFKFAQVEPYTMIIVIVLFITKILLNYWIIPIYVIAHDLLMLILSPLILLLT
jgi:Zn-dependent protease